MEWNFTYENQGTSAFLVFPLRETDELDTMGIGMISNNHIPHILPISFTQVDENRYLRYSISSKISLDNFFSGMVSKKRLLNVFIGICETIEAGSEYMLESDMLVLDKRYIFANVTTGEPDLVYLPILNQSEPLDFGRFFKEIMFSTQFDASEDCSYVAAIINHLNTNVNFSLKEFKTLLYTVRNQENRGVQQSEKAPVQRPAEQLSNAARNPVQPPKNYSAPAAPAPAAPKPVSPAPAVPKPAAPHPMPPAVPGKGAKPQAKEKVKEEKKKLSLFGGKADKKSSSDSGKAKAPAFAIPGMENHAAQTPPPAPGGNRGSNIADTTMLNIPPVNQPEAKIGFTTAKAQPVDWVKSDERSAYGQTTMLSAANGQTTVLSQNVGQAVPDGMAMQRNVPRPMLTQNKNGKKISIDKILFRIGTERSFVDLWISDNSAVSRSHADIINHEGKYFVRDNNSTNHTYLNGSLLVSNQEYPLTDGDQIILGNEAFQFELK